jgi:hypothetical protein
MLPSLDGNDAARRSLVTKNLGSALAAALSGAWKLPRQILYTGIAAPLRHRRRPSGQTIFTHQGWRRAPGRFWRNGDTRTSAAGFLRFADVEANANTACPSLAKQPIQYVLSADGVVLQLERFVLGKDDAACDSALRFSRAFFLR